MTRCVKALVAAASVVLTASLSLAASAAERWDMPMAYAATNYHSENGQLFADAVTSATGGELEIVTHPGGSLFKGGEIFRAVRTGQVPIGERLMSALGNEDPLFEVDALPFLATSFDEAWKLYQASKPSIEAALKKRGLKMLYAVPWPPQGLYSKNAVNQTSDLRGVKFRAYNAATSRLAELVGAIPTKIETAELSQAFATGVAESMITSGATGYDRKIWEYVQYWYDVQAWLPKNMVIVNLDSWNALDERTQGIVLGAASMAEAAGWAKAEELSAWYAEQLAANGMTVEGPSEQLSQEFQGIGETMTADWLERAGDVGEAIVEAFRSVM